ncbi:MAG TPA: restriction endonuclease subunit S [Solirubrobacterales bacterium]
MGEWTDMTLGDVLTLQRGFDITRKELREGSVPVVSSSGIAYHHAEAKVSGPGVVVGRKGSLGKVYFLEGPFWPHDTTLWVKDFKGNDPYFCYLLLKTLRLEELDVGAANPTLNRNHAHQLRVKCPDLESQTRIDAVISAFDRLIQVNERRIEILEDLARSLYREWFVHFRFPGHENVAFVDSEMGRVPEGWEVRRAGQVFSVLGGGTPSKKRDEYWIGGVIPWFTPSDLTRRQLRYVSTSSAAITDLGLQKSGARKFPPGSVLMTSRATLGVLAISKVEATCNQGFIVIPPTPDIPSEFVHEWLRSSAADLERLATGATFKEITKGAFKQFPVLVPASDVLAEFGAVVGPLGRLISSLEDASRKLMTTRDLLLPRLVTGQLDVSDVDLGTLTPPGSG